MAKYVITKDYLIFENILNDFNAVIPKQDIIKQADTLDKLFDTYVLKTMLDIGISAYRVYWNVKSLLDIKAKYDEGSISAELYGAIWITGPRGEPILKSVAKMDKEGRLVTL